MTPEEAELARERKKNAPKTFNASKPTKTPEEKEVERDRINEELRGTFSPDRQAHVETINYGNGTSEKHLRFGKTSNDYGGFGSTPSPPKPFKPALYGSQWEA